MQGRRFFIAGLVFFVSVVLVGHAFAASPVKYRSKDEVPRITVEELKAKLANGEKVYLLDVRTGASYDSSPLRIPGDIRSMFGELKAKTKGIPEDGEIITYCT